MPRISCDTAAEEAVGSFVITLITPAMADEPKSAEPPPRITSTRSIMLVGICSKP